MEAFFTREWKCKKDRGMEKVEKGFPVVLPGCDSHMVMVVGSLEGSTHSWRVLLCNKTGNVELVVVESLSKSHKWGTLLTNVICISGTILITDPFNVLFNWF
jgi:hypothetical protein